MKTTLQTIFTICLFLFIQTKVSAQGCVAIRSTGGLCAMDEHPDSTLKNGEWLYNTNGRYYQSYKHFVGKQEQYQRFMLHNNVINTVETDDNAITRVFNDRWSLSVTLPFAVNRRSQLAGGTGPRFSTHSAGLGDIRAAGYYWLFNPAKVHNFNIQVGLGIKFATGNDDVQDYFLQANGTRVLGPVDQSIQLGDGGTGYTLELNTFYNISHKFGFLWQFLLLSQSNGRKWRGKLGYAAHCYQNCHNKRCAKCTRPGTDKGRCQFSRKTL